MDSYRSDSTTERTSVNQSGIRSGSIHTTSEQTRNSPMHHHRSAENDMTIIRKNDPVEERSEERSENLDARELPCENRPHFYYPEWTGEECDHESFLCFSEGVNNNCCKCRPECCGQCNTVSHFNDPYQACPMLSSRASTVEERGASDTNVMAMVLIAFGIAFVLGCAAALWGHFEERKKMKMLVKDDKKKNLRAYRDDGEADDGVFKDQPYR